MARILVIDDEESIRFTFESFLAEAGHQVVCATGYDEALTRLSETECDLVFSDIILEGKTGLEFLRECRACGESCPVVMITGYPDVETASEAVRLGAFDYLPKPVEMEALLHITALALQHKRVTDEKERYRSHLEAIFRSVEDTIVTVDNDMVVTEVNDAPKGICGIDRRAIGQEVKSLELGCRGKCLEALRDTIDNKRSVKVPRLECRHPGCPPQIVNLSTYPLRDRRGSFSGAVMVMRDETRVVRLEQELCERQRLDNILGKSRRMQKLFSLIEALADVESTVLITGESGTGKELVADALHHLGARRHKPLVKVNCSALSESLVESELFGHVKGAFTGAARERVGRFQRASGGTIFLDEIGDLSPKVQASLLRVLQEREFERVGDSTPITVDVRVIAATHKDLQEKVRLGGFREDLLYRLKVVEVTLPPLRERREDIPVMVEHFVAKFNRKMKRNVAGISTGVEALFMEYAWPGNVRELEHALEHAFVVCHQDTITTSHLPPHLTNATHPGVTFLAGGAKVTPQAIVETLGKTAGNKKRAAQLLGIDRKTLYRNIAKYKIPEPTRDHAACQ
ncbi:MAG TPA: sigma 54-interacting transcriptional regulator [Candidatus Methylomirabilis sp.]|nr:sigma 54-interacting transcriptional regulator [Candidatus Methylomirabilis sp.]